MTNIRYRIVAVGVLTASCLAATAACSSSSNNQVSSPSGGSAAPMPYSPTAGMSAQSTPTALQTDVTLGAYCAPQGASGVNKSGLALTCEKDPSGHDRWVSAVPNTASAKAGTFCATNGQTATSGQQTKLVCKPGPDGRLRWTNSQSG